MATHSSIPSWRILWTEEPGRLKQSDMIWQLNNNKQFMHTDLFPFFFKIFFLMWTSFKSLY